jgi:hypothetical protein
MSNPIREAYTYALFRHPQCVINDFLRKFMDILLLAMLIGYGKPDDLPNTEGFSEKPGFSIESCIKRLANSMSRSFAPQVL